MANHKKNPSTQRPLLGQKILFIGDRPRACKQCGKSKKKGMFVRYEEELFCSERCVAVSMKA